VISVRIQRAVLIAGLALVGAGLAACGGSDPAVKTPAAAHDQAASDKPTVKAAPAGSPQAKQAASKQKAATKPEPSRKRDIASAKAQLQKASTSPQQGGSPRSICGLVSPAEASAILGKAVRAPVVAKQGPTCIYRTRGGDLTTVSVQAAPLRELASHMRNQRDVAVASRAGVCGTLGQPMLYLPVGGRQVLAVTGKCEVARQFASHALPRLTKP
jgi:hypothetical protein